MAELVGGAFLSSFLNVLIDRMASRPFLDFISGKKNDNELLMRKLKLKLQTANKLVDDAEEKQMTNLTVRKWRDDLKDAIYCVGELLDEINTEALRRQLEGEDDHSPAASSSISGFMKSVFKSSSPSDVFHNSLGPKISNILQVLDLILNEKDVLGLKEGVQHRPQDTTRQTTSQVDESGVFGREKDRETILKALRSDDTTGAKIGVLPIVGMGGIGKSTLAQLVYKDVKDDFDVQAWVYVGEEFGILQIAQTIYGKITKKPCTITDLDLLSEELKEVLTAKKFLFVLDDVWNEDYLRWNNLMTHFNRCGVHGSKIIVTTRLGSVASITGTLLAHYLKEISEDDSWLLFARHAFTDARVITAHPYLEVIGRQIVKKCQGLPLATKSLGGLLHSNLNPKDWEKILKNDVWKLSNDKILPALWLSYHYLPPHLKRCFAYCSIFPKGHEFKKSSLILLWMAEDLLQWNEEGVLDPEEVGSDYFDILLSRSLFQHSKWGFTMHDLINDLAKFVSGEFCMRLEENQPPNKNLCKTRHFSFMEFGGHGIQKFEALDEAKHLHTFLQLEFEYRDCNKLVLNYTLVDLLPNLPCLRVLKLSNTDIDELPSSIGNLKQLRHLDVSDTEIRELPETVCTLYNLQTLLLVDCDRLIQLPSNFSRLINLRHLKGATKIKKMPAGMCNLKNLQTLSDFVVDKQTAQRIGELKELQHLRKRLQIVGVGNGKGNALEADIMSNKEYLDKLVLRWGIREEDPYEGRSRERVLRDGRGDDHDPENDREVLNKLQPHTNLKQLVIISYGGVSFPGWLGDPSFSKLSCIKLVDFQHCCLLPPLGQLPSLKQLHVLGMNNVVEIGSEFYGNDGSRGNTTILFPNLRELVLKNCPKLTEILPLEKLQSLERIELCGLESISGSLSHVESECPQFLSLTYLHIEGCPNFVCFPDGGMDAPKLEYLHINGCEKLRSLPEQMHTLLPSLQRLSVIRCPEVESFPQGSGIMFPNLRELRLKNCPKLTEILPLEKLQSLERVELCGLESFSGSLSHVESECPQFLSLAHLKIEECPNFVCFPDGGMDAPKLEYLHINGCEKLRSLPEQMHTLLPSLQRLSVIRCPEVESFPQGSGIMFPNLRELRLKNCPKLTEILPLEKLQSLERIELCGLESLSGSLSHVESECPQFLSLTYLHIEGCPNFVCFPDGGMDAPKLEYLHINGCEKLRSLPEQMHTLLPSLQRLSVIRCPEVESFPQGSGIMFPNLRELRLKNCPKLTEILPLEKLQSLERIELCGLESLSGSLSHVESECPKFPSLTYLHIEGCPNFVCFPDGGMDAPKLEYLHINGWEKLRSLPEQMHTLLPSLQRLSVIRCPEVESFPQGSGIMFPNLRELRLQICPKLTEILPLEKLQSLKRVELCGLESFSGSLSHVESECPKFLFLTHLEIKYCPHFVCFPGGGMDAPKLEELLINGCKKLRSLPEQMPTLLPSLQKLEVFGCPKVELFPQGGLPSNLQDLSFECCRKLAAKRSLWGLTRLNSLRDLAIYFTEEGGEEMGCSFPEEGLLPATLTRLSIYNLPNLSTIQGKVLRQLTSLEDLTIRVCPELQGFPEEAPKSLKSLTIWECPNIGCLPGEWLPTSLSRLEIWRCPLLKERFRRETGEDWPKISHIPKIYID